MIEDSGGNLSNGEKQIVNFLRIMLRDSEIICLDEATSNMVKINFCQNYWKNDFYSKNLNKLYLGP